MGVAAAGRCADNSGICSNCEASLYTTSGEKCSAYEERFLVKSCDRSGRWIDDSCFDVNQRIVQRAVPARAGPRCVRASHCWLQSFLGAEESTKRHAYSSQSRLDYEARGRMFTSSFHHQFCRCQLAAFQVCGEENTSATVDFAQPSLLLFPPVYQA